MESFFSRYRNPMILGIVLLLQVFGLAVQLKRPVDPKHPEAGSVRMIRLWVSTLVTPVERVLVGTGHWFRQSWHDYINVGGLRRENEQLRAENEQLRINQSRIGEEASRAQRLEQLLDFKQHFAERTVAAQVIGSSGTEQSRVLFIDRGWHDGLRPDMAVVTPDGVVGKLRDVYPWTAQVLVLNDVTSGVGALIETSRLHGVVKGTADGGLVLDHVMVDEQVSPGDRVLTSGGDRIYPKGFPIGTVMQVSPGSDLFLNIRLKPAADLHRLEEVLVVTEPAPAQAETEAPVRAADILAQRLPGVNSKTEKTPDNSAAQGSPAPGAAGAQPGKTPPQTQQKTPQKTPAAPANPKATKPLTTTPPAVPTATGPAGAARVKKSAAGQGSRPGAATTTTGTTSGAAPTPTPQATPPAAETAPPAAATPTPTPPPSPTSTPPASTPETGAPKLQ